jgi:tetratricopeptide (TPR) repeat protein
MGRGIQFLEMPQPEVFVSYSHRDEPWKDRLVEHLAGLETEGRLAVWDDRRIAAGGDWYAEIERALASARVAVLLVTRHFLRSPFIREVEVPRLLERRQREGLHVVPVIVTSCLWQQVEFLRSINARPRDGRPLADFRGNQRDTQLAAIAEEILDLVGKGMAGGRASPSGPRSPRAVPAPEEPRQPSALHQLPSPPADFVGREADLAALRAVAGAGGPIAVFGLRGLGGVGKTALALKLAGELAPQYPDGQIFLDLQGVKTGVEAAAPLSPAQAMAHVIRSFLPEARLPEGVAELAGLYRTVLHGRRVLLLMDNAAGREQVEPLIPPEGCALLVTSRAHFHLPGAATRDLGELPEADARALLLGIAPRIGEEAAEIAGLCGRLPFALRLAGSALADRPDLTPADYARSLARAEHRFGPVEASIEVSLELLGEEPRRLWCRLAVFPGTFDLEAAAAVWEREPDEASAAMGELVTASLVEWEAGRYRLHDLARLFARGRLGGEETAGAERQHAAHYLEVLRRADALYEEGGGALLRGLRLFDAEWPNIQAGQAWAAAHSQHDEPAAALCDDYPNAGKYSIALRLHPREQIRWREAALQAARQRGDRSHEGFHLGNLGVAYRNLGEPHHAIDLYEQQLAIAREIGDRNGDGAALGNLGNAYAALGEPRRAIDFYEQHLAIAREIGDRRSESAALCNLGLAYAALGDPRRAIEFHEQDLVIAREIGDRRRDSYTFGNLGNAYAALGELRRAIEFHEQNLVIAREISDRRGEGNTLGNLGIAYTNLGEPRRAIELYEQQLAIAREIGDRRGEGLALGNLGVAYQNLGEPRRAIEFHEQDLAIAREIGDRDGETKASWNLGLVYEAEGDLGRAVSLMEIRVEYERKIGHPDAEKHAAWIEALRTRLDESPARDPR